METENGRLSWTGTWMQSQGPSVNHFTRRHLESWSQGYWRKKESNLDQSQSLIDCRFPKFYLQSFIQIHALVFANRRRWKHNLLEQMTHKEVKQEKVKEHRPRNQSFSEVLENWGGSRKCEGQTWGLNHQNDTECSHIQTKNINDEAWRRERRNEDGGMHLAPLCI